MNSAKPPARDALPALTPQVLLPLGEALKNGASRVRALKAVGISQAHFRRMQRLAEEGVEPYVSFIGSIERSEAELERKLASVIVESRDWHAAKAMLESLFPDEWAQKIKIELNNELEKFLKVAEKVLPPELFDQLIEAVANRGAMSAEGDPAEEAGTELH